MSRRQKLGEIDGLKTPTVRIGSWQLDEDDFLLIAMLQDPIYGPELMLSDPTSQQYGGCYRVYDYQYPLNRAAGPYQGHACARSVGKTESIKNKAFTHPFRRHGDNLLVTAPELIHLLPLTDAIEDRIRDCRLTRSILDTRGGKTGFTHRPFGVDFLDGTKIVGRIPRREGTGVKAQHQPDLIIDEGQDYPEKGWIEVHETVMKDRVTSTGDADFHYEFYGVHSGARDSGFFNRASSGGFRMVQVTAMQRPGWGKAEKEAAKAAYGGAGSPDYRRNILGEPGAAASAFFVLSRLMACMDQDRESAYNTVEYRHQELNAEAFDELGLPMIEALDLPTGYKALWVGKDIGLNQSPTVISLWAETTVKSKARLKLIRRFTLSRFRARHIVEAWLAIGATYGPKVLQGYGYDSTGLGLPIKQAMEDDQAAADWLLDRSRGYFFNAKVPVYVDPEFVAEDAGGRLRDQFGAAVTFDRNATGVEQYVTSMPMIEASTRYLRDWVDQSYLMLPFDQEIMKDLMAETQQRVKALGGVRQKPDAFHILDSFRAMAMVKHAEAIEAQLEDPGEPVLDIAVDLSEPVAPFA